jgi:protease-4
MPEETGERSAKKRRGCGLGCLLAAVLALGVVFLAGVGMVVWSLRDNADSAVSLSFGHGRSGSGEDENPRMREVWSSGHGDTKVVRIPLTGLIFLDGGGWATHEAGSTETTLRAIRRATHDTEVRAIILEVDSGGGGITASDILYRELCKFKEADEERVIVALMGDVAASGGYYVCLAADAILAHPTTLTGSIGVLMQSFNVRDLAQKIGVRDVTIKSGENKDLLNPMGELTPAQRTMLQGVVDDLHSRFVGLVAENRNLEEENVRALADGRVFLAEAAKEAGLIDGIGYAVDAEDTVSEMLDDAEIIVYRYEEEPSLLDFLRGGPSFFGRADLRGLLDAAGARLMYRWPF